LIAAIRLVLLTIFIFASGLFGVAMCLIMPFNRNHVHRVAYWYSSMHTLLGVKLVVTGQEKLDSNKAYVFVANHQNNYDLFTITKAVPGNTVSVGKKSIKFIPFFGQLYWLSGNILIDRKNKSKAKGTIDNAASKIKRDKTSVWMFPEGTRSYGRGLLPFKTGAFHTALQADVEVVPVCMSTTTNRIKLNRWSNSTVYIEVMEPVKLDPDTSARAHATEIHAMMEGKIKQLDAKVESNRGKLA
jgi:1-acyl-sn-glycerol-3-phosphate acyltransferase